MITIKKYKSPILPQCGFLCDGKLDDKLDKYELMKFLNCHTHIYSQVNQDPVRLVFYIVYLKVNIC